MAQQILRLPAVQKLTGMSRSTIYLYIKKGLFPQPCKIGFRSVGWPLEEINALIDARVRGFNDSAIQGMVKEIIASRIASLPNAA